MKTLILLLVQLAITAFAYSQDYVGTYEAVPPKGFTDDPGHKAGWEMSKLRFQILPDRITFTYGPLKPGPSNVTYTKEGSFLLAKDERETGTMYIPIYLFDKDTIFTMGCKLVRSNDDKGIEEEHK